MGDGKGAERGRQEEEKVKLRRRNHRVFVNSQKKVDIDSNSRDFSAGFWSGLHHRTSMLAPGIAPPGMPRAGRASVRRPLSGAQQMESRRAEGAAVRKQMKYARIKISIGKRPGEIL